MKPSLRVSTGLWFIRVGVVVWFVETWYFGWNLTAQSRAEVVWDYIVAALMLIGFLLAFRVMRRDRALNPPTGRTR